MGRKARTPQALRVRQVRDRIALWRRTREKRSPMPAELWAEAVALARTEGTYRIAHAVGVDYGSLARRVAEVGAADGGEAAAARGFVEIAGPQLFGETAQAGPVVEVCDGDGGRLTIRLGREAPLDVAAVVQGFRGRRG
jgi:hypothetical protein